MKKIIVFLTIFTSLVCFADPGRDALPSGAVIGFASATCPAGWILADGTNVSRSTYSRLFTAIGSAHGSGNGTTTFGLPDYRGRFLRGVDLTAGNDPDKTTRTAMATGGNVGNLVGSVQGQATRKNGMTMTDPGHAHNLNANATNGGAGQGAIYSSVAGASYTNTFGILSSTTGITLNNGDNETRPVNAAVTYCIKI